jgi:hypothetical protein
MCDWIYPDLSGFIQICPDLLMIYPPILILETPMFTMFTMFKMPISSMDPPIFWAPPSRSCWCSGLPIPKDPDLQNSFVGWIMLDPKFNPGWWCHPIKKKRYEFQLVVANCPKQLVVDFELLLESTDGFEKSTGNHGFTVILKVFLSSSPILARILKRSGLYKGRNPFTEWIPRKGMLCVSQFGMFSESGAYIIELDDGKIYRKPLYLIV